jgi:hypothetical protein
VVWVSIHVWVIGTVPYDDRHCCRYVSSWMLSTGMSRSSCDGRVNRMYKAYTCRLINAVAPMVQTTMAVVVWLPKIIMVIKGSCMSSDQ